MNSRFNACFRALTHKNLDLWSEGLQKKALCNKVVIALAIACTECFYNIRKQLTRLMVCGSVSDYLVSSFLGGFATAKILLFYEMQMVFEQIISLFSV